MSTQLDLKIIAKQIELLEMKIKSLENLKPEVYETRLKSVEEKIYVSKEMLTLPEVSSYLGITISQTYKMTSDMTIPHYKPRGKIIYFDKKEIIRWMKKNHCIPSSKNKE